MKRINTVTISGRATRDPDTKEVRSGLFVTNIGLVFDNGSFDKKSNEWKEKPGFADVTVWGKEEDQFSHIGKGDQVLFSGRLDMEKWDDKKTGEERTKLKLVGDVFLLEKSKKREESYEDSRETVPPSREDDDFTF